MKEVGFSACQKPGADWTLVSNGRGASKWAIVSTCLVVELCCEVCKEVVGELHREEYREMCKGLNGRLHREECEKL